MKKLVFAISSLTLPLFLLIPKARADVTNDVHVSTDGGNANSSVVINNSGSTNSTSSYTTGGSTNIHVETNGQGYDYHSDQPGSVNVQSVNGKVTVNGQPQNTTSNATTPSPTMSASDAAKSMQARMEEQKLKSASDAAAIKKHADAMRKAQENFFQKLLDSLKNLFHLG